MGNNFYSRFRSGKVPITTRGFPAYIHFWILEKSKSYKLLVLPYKNGYKSLLPEQILYVKSNDNYCKVVSASGTFTLRSTIKACEEKLAAMPLRGTIFVRIHSSYLISLSEVEFDKTLTEVTVSNGDILPVSKPYRKNLDDNLEFL